jgi:hypothetical protein
MGDAYETALLTLEFNNTNIANVGDATGLRGSSTAGSFYVGLHTADPGEAGSQTRAKRRLPAMPALAWRDPRPAGRSAAIQVSNTAAITFAQNTGSDQTVTHFSIGVASGRGQHGRPLWAADRLGRYVAAVHGQDRRHDHDPRQPVLGR